MSRFPFSRGFSVTRFPNRERVFGGSAPGTSPLFGPQRVALPLSQEMPQESGPWCRNSSASGTQNSPLDFIRPTFEEPKYGGKHPPGSPWAFFWGSRRKRPSFLSSLKLFRLSSRFSTHVLCPVRCGPTRTSPSDSPKFFPPSFPLRFLGSFVRPSRFS